MKTCTYCLLFGLDWIYNRVLVLPPLFTFHYFKLSHTVRPLLVNHNHSYFSLITTHFHFSFFDNSLSQFTLWNSLSLFIVGNQASPKLVVPPSCEPKFVSSAITFKAHQTTLFGGSGGSKCGQQKYKIEFALSLVNVNFQTWFCRLVKKPFFWIVCLSIPMSIGQIRLLDFTEQTQSLISAVPTLDRGFWQALPSLVPPIKRVTAVTLDFLQCNQART